MICGRTDEEDLELFRFETADLVATPLTNANDYLLWLVNALIVSVTLYPHEAGNLVGRGARESRVAREDQIPVNNGGPELSEEACSKLCRAIPDEESWNTSRAKPGGEG